MRFDIASTRGTECEPAASFENTDFVTEGVALLRWPEHRAERTALEQAHQPRLLVVPDHMVPPSPVDELEDWTRASSTEDVAARVDALSRRSRARVHGLRLSGRQLHRGPNHVDLTPTQCTVAAPLIDRCGLPVARTVVADALAQNGRATSATAIRSLLVRLDRAVAPLGLRVWLLGGPAVMLEAGVVDAPSP